MFIEKGLPWFMNLLEQTSEDITTSDREINAKNCVGTVLAINGHRNYFSMYHARHPEGARQKLVQRNAGKTLGTQLDAQTILVSGDFWSTLKLY